MPRSILFVCLGNICRSPAAEAVLNKSLEEAGLGACYQVDSAGTASYHLGKRADSRMIAAAERRGYDVTSRARQIQPADLTTFELIVVMDRENFAAVQRLGVGASEKVKMLSDFLDDQWPRDVPDPYLGDEAGFEYVLNMLEAASPRIIEYLQARAMEVAD